MGNEEILILDEKEFKKVFKFEYQFSFLSIKKIIVSHLFGVETKIWFHELMKRNIYLEISLKKTDNSTYKYPIMLMNYVSPMHLNAVFEFKKNEFIIPEENFNNKSALSPYYSEGEIKLKFNDIEKSENIDDIKITIIYEKSTGTTLV